MEDFGPLPDMYAEAYALAEQGMSGSQIADLLFIAPSTAKHRVRKAKLHLLGITPAREPRDIGRIDFERGDLSPCKRCGLRGPHECMGRAEDYLGNRDEPNF